MKKQTISFITDAILAGIMLSIGCAVNMSADSKVLGSFLFSLGLFAIIHFKMGLYTGKAGYMALKPPSYIGEVALTLFGDAIGTAIGGTLLRFTRFGSVFTEKASAAMLTKMTDAPLSAFILAIFCGILMYVAVEGNNKTTKEHNWIGSLFAVVLPVMVFITCGFNHCVADLASFFISGCANAEYAAVYFPIVIIGNAVGCMTIPMIKKLSVNK